jgi:hypothetical protein
MKVVGQIAQIIIAVGIFNVWGLRYNLAPGYRGGGATNMREEFAAYGMPFGVMCVIGALKVSLAIALLVGLREQVLVTPAATAMALLMIGAIAMHFRIGDPIKKAVPAACMLILSIIAAVA